MLVIFLAVLLNAGCGRSSPFDGAFRYSADIIPTSSGAPVAPALDCNPDERSLHSILWSCTLTTFLCTWVAVHPNIPHPTAKQWDVFKARVYLVLIGIISPEIVVLLAARQFYGSKHMIAGFQECDVQISKAQAHFVQMGGLMLYKITQRLGIIDSYTLYQLMAGRDFEYYIEIHVQRAEIASFRLPSDEEIWDSSKGDWVTKTIGAAQVSWFVFQCVTRWANGLGVTKLELFTFALSALNGVIYFLWWDKPVDIRFRHSVVWIPADAQEAGKILEIRDKSVPKSVIRLSGRPWWKAPAHFWRKIEAIVDFFSLQYRWEPRDGMMQIFIACTELGTLENQVEVVTISCLTAIMFGAIHMVAWAGPFPTRAEQVVWRVCAVLTTSLPIFPFFWRVHWQRDAKFVIRTRTRRQQDPLLLVFLRAVTYTLIPVYIFARLGLLFVAFSSLRDSAAGVGFEEHSPLFLPHF